MKAITYDRYGGPEVLRVSEVPEPKLGPDSILIDVKAASVNPVDWQIAAGQLDSRFDIRFPVIPGWEEAAAVPIAGLTAYQSVVHGLHVTQTA